MTSEIEIEMESVLDELYHLRGRVIDLEKENMDLLQNLRNAKNIQTQLENSLLLSDIPAKSEEKPKRIAKVKTDEQRGFHNYYQKNKKNPDITKKLQKRLKDLGYPSDKVPLYIYKMECKTYYDKLTNEEKQQYLK